ncbi:carbonic anhydrase [Lyophyllum atratum]|nr:carbonic anhydrase [Lyophyllum atratum]
MLSLRGLGRPDPFPHPLRAQRLHPAPLIHAFNETNAFDLKTLLEGNQKFREQKEVTASLTESPGVMFIGCSDNRCALHVPTVKKSGAHCHASLRLSTNAIFQIQPGSTVSHVNLANQFTGKDPSSDAAVAYAVNNLGVQHIIVLGHYGCKSVHTAMAAQPMDRILQTWLQPVADIFSRSKRAEIKKVINLRRWNDNAGAAKADDDAFHALVEENVKTTVKNLQNESLLSIAYNKRNDKTNHVHVFVHGLVVNEENGEVKDLGVSFGPPGQTIPKLPFEVIAEAKHHNSFGKYKPKAKKLDPTSTSTSPVKTSTSSTPMASETG